METLLRWLAEPERAAVRSLLLAGERIAQEWVGLEVLAAGDRAGRIA